MAISITARQAFLYEVSVSRYLKLPKRSGTTGVASNSGYRRSVQQFQCSMAVLELLARATEAWVVAAGNEHLVNRSSCTVDGVSRRCTAGKPVRMDVASGWRYQFYERLMSRIGILVSLD